ncbi:MAG: hypothetical protein O7J95_14095, partial [Planctomycetota bacterium]|nr:hypothetical protein [Planctomycetota bacterium]
PDPPDAPRCALLVDFAIAGYSYPRAALKLTDTATDERLMENHRADTTTTRTPGSAFRRETGGAGRIGSTAPLPPVWRAPGRAPRERFPGKRIHGRPVIRRTFR